MYIWSPNLDEVYRKHIPLTNSSGEIRYLHGKKINTTWYKDELKNGSP